ncbi:hypothetical protein ABRZ03_02230 [Castellaniella ginsengisoli]|uniref:Uncharacterized protein n=1 Tax=Castellaniella ginsengisoli TaxID=546114 RepID=A0AB39ECB6_9BURK
MAADTPLGNFGLIRLAWKNAGGISGICRSIEFLLSCIAWILTAPAWVGYGWWDEVLAVLPTLLGFTLSGFAIFLGFGSEDFKRFLANSKNPDESLYMSVGSAFLLFVTCQTLAILYALIAKALYFPTPNFLLNYFELIKIGSYVGGGIGYFLFLFSLALSLRAALRVYRMSRWYNFYLNQNSPKNKLHRRRVSRYKNRDS